MHWFPIGLSIMITAFSAINYIAFSGEVYEHGLYVMLCLPVFVFVALPITRVVMPFYHSMELGSAYEYLERRFTPGVRALASGLFISWQVLWMATLLYVPCKVLGLLTGWEAPALILLAGAVTTTYTLAGGMRAVMWTDVAQFLVVVGGLLVGLSVAVARASGGLPGLLHSGIDAGLARPFHPFDPQMLSFDPSVRITLWSCWLGTLVAFLARYGTDQTVVQRYFTARSLRHAQIGFHLNYASALLALLLLGVLGFAIHAHELRTGSAAAAPPLVSFAAFVRSLPPGIPGLIVAGLFAATMSSLSSGINACAAAFTTDFYRPWTGEADGPGEFLYSRLAVLAIGAAASVGAVYIGRLGSIFEIANRIINGLGTPLLALFLLGMFSRRANAGGMLVGGLLGILGSAYVSFAVQDLALHYYPVLNLVITLVPCYLFSLAENRLTGPPTAGQLAWTWAARRRQQRSTTQDPSPIH
jgi:SSS family transporter